MSFDKVALYELLRDHLSLEDLRELAFFLGIDEDNLPGEKNRFLRAFINECERRDLISALTNRVRRNLPNAPWETVLAAALELNSEDHQSRAATIRALPPPSQANNEATFQTLVDCLADDYLLVQAAAIEKLARFWPARAWREKLQQICFIPDNGPFIMGDDESLAYNEKPAHPVSVPDFYITRYPVTNARYNRYALEQGLAFQMPVDRAGQPKKDHPVVGLTWQQAAAYAAWAGMRLPTEAEWEKAASWSPHGQSKQPFPWGEMAAGCCNSRQANIGSTTPVDAYSPEGDSRYGVCDMSGNVWEWCDGFYIDKYPFDHNRIYQPSLAVNMRVRRGGSYAADLTDARCTRRSEVNTHHADNQTGFRLAWSSSAAGR